MPHTMVEVQWCEGTSLCLSFPCILPRWMSICSIFSQGTSLLPLILELFDDIDAHSWVPHYCCISLASLEVLHWGRPTLMDLQASFSCGSITISQYWICVIEGDRSFGWRCSGWNSVIDEGLPNLMWRWWLFWGFW